MAAAVVDSVDDLSYSEQHTPQVNASFSPAPSGGYGHALDGYNHIPHGAYQHRSSAYNQYGHHPNYQHLHNEAAYRTTVSPNVMHGPVDVGHGPQYGGPSMFTDGAASEHGYNRGFMTRSKSEGVHAGTLRGEPDMCSSTYSMASNPQSKPPDASGKKKGLLKKAITALSRKSKPKKTLPQSTSLNIPQSSVSNTPQGSQVNLHNRMLQQPDLDQQHGLYSVTTLYKGQGQQEQIYRPANSCSQRSDTSTFVPQLQNQRPISRNERCDPIDEGLVIDSSATDLYNKHMMSMNCGGEVSIRHSQSLDDRSLDMSRHQAATPHSSMHRTTSYTSHDHVPKNGTPQLRGKVAVAQGISANEITASSESGVCSAASSPTTGLSSPSLQADYQPDNLNLDSFNLNNSGASKTNFDMGVDIASSHVTTVDVHGTPETAISNHGTHTSVMSQPVGRMPISSPPIQRRQEDFNKTKHQNGVRNKKGAAPYYCVTGHPTDNRPAEPKGLQHHHLTSGVHRPPPPDVAQSDVLYRLKYLLNGATCSGQNMALRSSQPSPAPSHISLLVTDESGVTGRRSPREVIAQQQMAAAHLKNDSGLSVTQNRSYSPGMYGALNPTSSRTSLNSNYPMRVGTPTDHAAPRGTPILEQRSSDGRPYSINTTAAGAVEDLFSQRRAFIRRSARSASSHKPLHSSRGLLAPSGKVHSSARNLSGSMSSVRFQPIKPPTIHLTAIQFEIVQTDAKPVFVGRTWLFDQMQQVLLNSTSNDGGIVIAGGVGSGKTSIIAQLIANSCFSNDHVPNINSNDVAMTAVSSVYALSSRVVSVHVCQADNNITCVLPEFVHSTAAYLCKAPHLTAYRELLLNDQKLQDTLSMRRCVRDPSRAFKEGILQPLAELKLSRKISTDTCIMLVDGLDEAQYHMADFGDTIPAFLSKHVHLFPQWLKIIVTVRSSRTDLVRFNNSQSAQHEEPKRFYRVDLDSHQDSNCAFGDINDYILYRFNHSQSLKSYVCISDDVAESQTIEEFSDFVQKQSKGSFLYVQLLLDLIEHGYIELRNDDYKSLPKDLSALFLKQFEIKFPTIRTFERVDAILSICLASLYPLTQDEIYDTLRSHSIDNSLTQQDFNTRLNAAATDLMAIKRDGTYVYLHNALREWLQRREEHESKNFQCNVRLGHNLLALRLTRLNVPLGPDKTLELGHHILKAHVYKNVAAPKSPDSSGWSSAGVFSRDMHALWVAMASECPTAALFSPHNLYATNIKVSRLMILAGADINKVTPFLHNAPALCVSSAQGNDRLTSLLLECGAAAHTAGTDGLCALSHAAINGRVKCIRILTRCQAVLNQVDNQGYCALVHAAKNGQLDALKELLNADWTNVNELRPTKHEALQQALVSAATNGHAKICELLLEQPEALNGVIGAAYTDTITGETALTAACLYKQENVINVLLKHPSSRNISLSATNTRGVCPILCAVRAGVWQHIDLLLRHEAMTQPRTQTVIAEIPPSPSTSSDLPALLPSNGDIKQLGDGDNSEASKSVNQSMDSSSIGKGSTNQSMGSNRSFGMESQLSLRDQHGRTALMLAASEGHLGVLEMLLARGACIKDCDDDGMTPLSWGCLRGNLHVIQSLVERGANINHQDRNGRSPLDLAAFSGEPQSVQYLLDQGANIENMDNTRMKPLERAICCKHRDVVICFLRKGAKLGPNTWQMASTRLDMMALLLNKLMEDGNILYKKNRLPEATHRYQYALKKFPIDYYASEEADNLREIKLNLLLNLSRCKYKMNEIEECIELCTKALGMQPDLYQAFYTRARARKHFRQYQSAIHDLDKAIQIFPEYSEAVNLRKRIIYNLQQGNFGSDRPQNPAARNTERLNKGSVNRIPQPTANGIDKAAGSGTVGYVTVPDNNHYQSPYCTDIDSYQQSLKDNQSNTDYQPLHNTNPCDNRNNNLILDTSQQLGYTQIKPPDIVPQYCESPNHQTTVHQSNHTPGQMDYNCNTNSDANHHEASSSAGGGGTSNSVQLVQPPTVHTKDKGKQSTKHKLTRIYTSKSKKNEETSF